MAAPVQWLGNTPVATSFVDEKRSSITQLTNGNFLVVYETADNSGNTSQGGTDIAADLYDPLGNLLQNNVLLSPGAVGDDAEWPAITALANGGFRVTYRVDFAANPAGMQDNIFIATYDANLAFVTSNVLDPFGTFQSEIAAASSGDISMNVWVTQANDAINGNILLADGTILNPGGFGGQINIAETPIPGDTVAGLDIATLNNGNFVVSWVRDVDGFSDIVQSVIYDTTGTAVSGEISVYSNGENSDTSVAALSDGRFAIAWVRELTGGDTEVRAAIRNADGSLSQSSFLASSSTLGPQLSPVIVGLPDGDFIVFRFDDFDDTIWGQRFNADTSFDGGEFGVVSGANFLKELDATVLEDGRVAISWTRELSASDDDIRFAIFDPRDVANTANPAYTNNLVVGTVGVDIITAVDGVEYALHTGNDSLIVGNGSSGNSISTLNYDGGDGTDQLQIFGTGTFDFTQSTASITSIEDLFFNRQSITTSVAELTIFGDELSSIPTMGFASGSGLALRADINVETKFGQANFDLSGISLVSYTPFLAGTDRGVKINITPDLQQNNITGTVGNDTFKLGAEGVFNTDGLDGHDGIDTIDLTGATTGFTRAVVFRDVGSSISIVGGASNVASIENFENVIGSEVQDSLFDATTTPTANVFEGNDGDDFIIGGLGADATYGGAGSDVFFIRNSSTGNDLDGGTEIIDGGADFDTVTVLGGDVNFGTFITDFRTVEFAGIEQVISGDISNPGDFIGRHLQFNQSQFGTGLANDLVIQGRVTDDFADEITVYLDSETDTFDASGFTFTNWTSSDQFIVRNDSATANQKIIANEGTDLRIIGNDGVQTISYENASQGASLSLSSQIGGGGNSGNGFGGAATDHTYDRVENATGSIYSDDITGFTDSGFLGTFGPSTLMGLGGNDLLRSGSLETEMIGGTGNDQYFLTGEIASTITELEGEGEDFVYVEEMSSYTLGDNLERLIFTSTGNHTGKGNELDNRLNGNAGVDRFLIDEGGADTFSGGPGVDIFDARGSDNEIRIFLNNQALNGGAAEGDMFASIEIFAGSNSITDGDIMRGGDGRARFQGGNGDDLLIGANNIDFLRGDNGNDTLIGGNGRDTLNGGKGNDMLTGGNARDQFNFVQASFGQDTITDYQDGLDYFKVFNVMATSFSDVTITDNGTSTVRVTLDSAPANYIDVNGINGTDVTLTASDFQFY
ncbi:beta strand repeat-containing protein [Pseudahrensia aquimaris]|uniref:Beta strand repeat-containing protein n=1 Tax=Pseudahrensia aquimaris TaxID=744461 RepID=A0ABW3FAR9_9HYPH